MYELFAVIGIFGFWLLLQLVILPRLGYSTCVSGACALGSRRENEKANEDNF